MNPYYIVGYLQGINSGGKFELLGGLDYDYGFVPYKADSADILAEDWEIVENDDRLRFRVWDKRLNRYLGKYDPSQMLMSNGATKWKIAMI